MDSSGLNTPYEEIDINSNRASNNRSDIILRPLHRSEDDHDRLRYSMDTCDEILNTESAHNFSALKLEDPELLGHDDNVVHTLNQVSRLDLDVRVDSFGKA